MYFLARTSEQRNKWHFEEGNNNTRDMQLQYGNDEKKQQKKKKQKLSFARFLSRRSGSSRRIWTTGIQTQILILGFLFRRFQNLKKSTKQLKIEKKFVSLSIQTEFNYKTCKKNDFCRTNETKTKRFLFQVSET